MLVAELSPEDAISSCSFCGESKPSAMWRGQIEIFACTHCASEFLPQLMADAIVGGLSLNHINSSSGPTDALTKQSRIIERFNGAFSGALLRKIRLGPSA